MCLEVQPLQDPATVERLMGIALNLAGAVDYKGIYRAHSQTVAELAHAIGEHIGCGPDALRRLTIAGLLHDVGKLQIPDRILLKPASLDEAEYEKIKQHPMLGHSTLIALGLPDEAKWVLHHHERSDGGGYPSGLAGDQIPLGSRILLAADAWECMTATRPYRAGLSRYRAAEEMMRCCGTQFDCHVVEALLSVTLSPRY
jgi:HD-GYP domain-containing protein (c-di-GMP phosphodiesterase class II)